MPHDSSEKGYRLLDCGRGEKLESVAGHLMRRPAPSALWAPKRNEWPSDIPHYQRSSSGGGDWDHREMLPAQWTCELGEQIFETKPTGFGHIGLFAEQAPFWKFLREQCAAAPGMRALNLFAYTGGSTLACARGGAEVTHCDASKGVVAWGRENAKLNGLGDAPIRWIVEDALKYLRRELKRGSRYRGIILDPPSFGRGPKGEVWKLEEGLEEMLALCVSLLDDAPRFFLLSAHTPGLGPLGLHGMLDAALREHAAAKIGSRGYGEMTIPAESGAILPSGSWAAWVAAGALPAPTLP